MIKNDTSLNMRELNLISHSLGMRHFKAHRNYFNSGSVTDNEWDVLVEKGIAKRIKTSDERGGYYYYLTDDFLKNIEVEVLK